MKTNNKTILKGILGLFMILASVSCQEEIGPAGPTTNHRVFYTNQSTNANTINVGGRIDFADVSQGVEFREWTFPESAQLDAGVNEVQVSAIFQEAGVFEIKLFQQFADSAFVERDPVKRGHELDTTFNVTVLPLVEVTSVSANLLNSDGSLGNEVVLQDGAQTEIFAGSTLRLTYAAIGDPSEISGDFHGSVLVGQDTDNGTFDVKFGSLGVFSLSAYLTRPQPRSADTVAYTDYIKTVSSPDPVIVNNVSDTEGNVLVEFSRDLDPTTVNSSDFSVKIETLSGATLTPLIESAELDPNNAAAVLLTISGDQVYSDDNVTATYTAGSLKSADQKLADSFVDEELVHTVHNFLEADNYDYSFDRPWAEVAWVHNFNPAYSWWNGALSTDFVATKSSEQVHDGAFSLKVDANAAVKNVGIFPQNGDGSQHLMNYEGIGETAKLSAWVYLETTLENPGNSHLKLRMPELEMGWGAHGPAEFFNAVPAGEWVLVEDIVSTANASGVGATVCVNPVNFATNRLVFYIDGMVLQTWNARPE